MWLDRTLFQGPKLALVASQRGFRSALRQIDYRDDGQFCEPGWHACTHAYRLGSGVMACIVGVNLPMLKKMDPIDAAAVLVHEAVHVWQRVRADLGPGDLGVEMEAYAVQNISAALMHAFVKASSSGAKAVL